MSETPPEATVLIVEDEVGLADLYTQWLDDSYAVITAVSGEEALDQVDEDTDVVLLDRRMPGMNGGEVLTEFRDQGLDCNVVMVTGVTPDFDIIEMGFNDYLTKPIRREVLQETIERQLKLRECDGPLQEHFSLAVKISALQTNLSEEKLIENDQYAELESRFEEIEDEARTQLDELFDSRDSEEIYRMVPQDGD